MADLEKYGYNSIDVAKYIVAVANERHLSINMTKVQKLLYIAYGFFLVVKGYRLTNEHPQTWPYGPVFPTTRNKLLKVDLYSINMNDECLSKLKDDNDLKSLTALVFNNFGEWSAAKLTEWSHSDGSPWERTVGADNFTWGDRIPDEYIMSYFDSMIQKDNDQQSV